MAKDFLTLDDVEVKGKSVLVRVDVNCPIHHDTKEISNDERIKLHASTTIKELKDKGAKVVLMSHQGRPGDSDFISLDKHSALFQKYLGNGVSFVDDIFGTHAQDKIKALKEGDVLLLENVRFYSEEMLNRPADVQSKTPLVSKLSPCIDFYVNDAFAAIHRSQPSLVGFSEAVPTVAGRVMEKEFAALDRVIEDGEKPIMFVLGGVKVKESLKVMNNLLRSKRADMILTGGLLGNLLLKARGYDIGPISWEVLKGKNIDTLLPEAKKIVQHFGDKIETPVDVAVNNNGRKELEVGELPTAFMISDIGRETVGRYARILEDAKTIVMNSPLGRFELPEFAYATEKLLEKASTSKAFAVVGGGHSAKLVSEMNLKDKFDHVSIGGRATLYHLSGEQTPVVEMLKKAHQKWNSKGDSPSTGETNEAIASH